MKVRCPHPSGSPSKSSNSRNQKVYLFRAQPTYIWLFFCKETEGRPQTPRCHHRVRHTPLPPPGAGGFGLTLGSGLRAPGRSARPTLRWGFWSGLWGFPYLHVAIHLLEQANSSDVPSTCRRRRDAGTGAKRKRERSEKQRCEAKRCGPSWDFGARHIVGSWGFHGVSMDLDISSSPPFTSSRQDGHRELLRAPARAPRCLGDR